MPTDPASIPQHVVKAALPGVLVGAWCLDLTATPPAERKEEAEDTVRAIIAVALDALLTEEPIVFTRTYRIPLTIVTGDTVDVYVKPSDVLAAVLERKKK